MGNCCTGLKGEKYLGDKSTASEKFKQTQLELIKLMYANLSKRCRNNLVTRQTFDLFFHSSGLIGEILFLRFDKKKNGTISFGQFLAAFELMIKGSLRERADILFQIYDVYNSGGVKYEELLKILFSYNIEELNKMFIEEKFLNFIGPAQLTYYFGAEKKKIEEKIILEEEQNSREDNSIKKIMVPSSVVLHKVERDISKSTAKLAENEKTSDKKPNKIDWLEKKFAKKEDKKQTVSNSTLLSTVSDFKQRNKVLKIKSNIASLTKKYANFLFTSANLNKEKDFFSKQNFFNLIQEHPSLFNAYLSGFHTYIWQVGDDGQPQYFKAVPWIQSEAEERYNDNSEVVFLKFIQYTVFVMKNKKRKIPKQIINLEGLTVDTIEEIKEGKQEFGIVFKHRDGLYEAKQYYFKQKAIFNQWVKHLADFRTTTMEDQYTKLEKIGGGNYSSVFRGKDKKTQQEVAIKVIQTFKLSVAEKEVLKRQTGILKLCRHPNIIKFYGQFKTKTHIYIVTEILSEGDLFEYTKRNGFLQEYEAAVILKQLIDAILYLNEELGIIHRDLKPENVLIKMNDEKKMVLRVKLIDFGFGVFRDKIKDLPPKEKFAGTPGFIAPQIYKAEDYDQKIDTFSLGIILYFMLSGQFPFHSPFLEQIEELTKSCTLSMVNNHWANISDDAKDLLSKILCFKQNRISTRDVAGHPWLSKIDNLKKYIGRNPRKNKGFIQ